MVADSWCELFLLSCADLLPPLDLSTLADGRLLQEATRFQETIAVLKTLHLDPYELFLVKVMQLFKTSEYFRVLNAEYPLKYIYITLKKEIFIYF